MHRRAFLTGAALAPVAALCPPAALAHGGKITPRAYLVGERGAEMVMPASRASVLTSQVESEIRKIVVKVIVDGRKRGTL